MHALLYPSEARARFHYPLRNFFGQELELDAEAALASANQPALWQHFGAQLLDLHKNHADGRGVSLLQTILNELETCASSLTSLSAFNIMVCVKRVPSLWVC